MSYDGPPKTDAERARRLEEQLDGWAVLLGITKDYWIPADQKEEYENQRRFFFVLSDYGRKAALKTSKFNVEALAFRKALEAECDRVREEKHALMRQLEDALDWKRVAKELEERCNALTDLSSKQRAALEQAEDFVVTHAAQGDEKLLAVIGAALDGG